MLLKKTFVFLLAFLYIASSCEATVYLHYCMGKRIGFSFTPTKFAECPRCGMKKTTKSMGCCKDEPKIVKTDKSQKLTDFPVSKSQEKKFTALTGVFFAYATPVVLPEYPVSFSAHGPPLAAAKPLYLLQRSLLI